jgi:hypothetical protein
MQPNNVSRGFDRNPARGDLPTFCVSGTRKKSHSASKSRKEPCPGPPKHKGPSTPNALQNRPLSSAECCAVFSPNRRAFLCRGQCSVGLSCTPTCSAISPRVTGPAVQMKSHSNRDKSHASTSVVSWAFLLQIQSLSVGRSSCEMPLLLVASFQRHCWLALF